MNLFDFLQKTDIQELELPTQLIQKLKSLNLNDFKKIYTTVQAYKSFGKIAGAQLSEAEMKLLDKRITALMIRKGLIKTKTTQSAPAVTKPPSPSKVPNKQTNPEANPSSIPDRSSILEDGLKSREQANHIGRPSSHSTHLKNTTMPLMPEVALANWENRLVPLLRKVELIGEIPITKEELDDISKHLSRLFYNRKMDDVLAFVGHNYPATFLTFMVGHGIFGYGNNGFWPAYEKALNQSVDSIAFGRLFEKLLARHGKPVFRDLQEKSLRYVSLVLAHGGIPVYCLKDFFNNIVLNSVIRPQLFALDGDELVDEILRHPAYTAYTDRPVLYFLEYGGSTATNLLDRARKMLLSWQQNQSLLTVEEAGLPAHIIQFFEDWTRENASVAVDQGSRNRLKRPQLCLDPWGLGIFLELPSQPVSMSDVNDLRWRVDTGETHEEIKARTQRKGDRVETREITFRLSHVSEQVHVQFSKGGNEFEWEITGYSKDHHILAFDPVNGRNQNRILARETWLLFPHDFTLSILDGEGDLLEVLPDLPGEWSKFRLECWDFSRVNRLGLIQHGQVFREIFVRSNERIEPPSLVGDNYLSADLEENPYPLYSGKPPALRIPLPLVEDLGTELGRWKVRLENLGVADPEIFQQVTLAELNATECAIIDQTATIQLASPRFLTAHPAGTYQITIKGPLGRDATFTFQILPEFGISGLKELYIPDRKHGPQSIKFSLRVSLLAGVEPLNGGDGIKVEAKGSGNHQVLVPPDVSLVGLLIRRETIRHQYIQIPVYFHLKRLRWRMVGDDGLVDNWLQKHAMISIQDLLQQESPLLIVDLPGNQGGNLTLSLNLVDIQGNVIQQLKPADRPKNRAIRFWRFDLSKIKHSIEMNDSPLFRLDLVGTNISNQMSEFDLPMLVFNRAIRLTQLKTEVYSSSEQHHILVTWKGNKQLRSRSLILWSLFRPWLPPIVENIPDSASEEYEFSISRRDYAEGIYRVQMIVVDPWAPSPPPSLPPDDHQAVCHDLEISSPVERLKKLEKEIGSATVRQTTQFSNRIEISLIRQHLGEMEASHHDLAVCCRNLLPATSREILTLRSILSLVNSKDLEKDFGEQVISPDIISRLYKDLQEGKITLTELLSVIKLAPHSKYWPAGACEILLQLEDPKISFRALTQLVSKDISRAVDWILKLLQQSKMSPEDAVALLYEEKFAATEQLRKLLPDPKVEELQNLLERFNLLTGLPLIRPGSWVLTNAGWGRIDTILDPRTRLSVDSFMEGDGKFILSVTMHIYESYDLTGETAIINMLTNLITFPRVKNVFICNLCENFVTASMDILKSHQIAVHGSVFLYPGEKNKDIQLTSMQFNLSPQQIKKDQ